MHPYKQNDDWWEPVIMDTGLTGKEITHVINANPQTTDMENNIISKTRSRTISKSIYAADVDWLSLYTSLTRPSARFVYIGQLVKLLGIPLNKQGLTSVYPGIHACLTLIKSFKSKEPELTYNDYIAQDLNAHWQYLGGR